MFKSKASLLFLRLPVLCSMLLVGGSAREVLAQGAATLSGRVLDPQGGALPGALVSISNLATRVELTAVASDDGTFVFANVPLQRYRLTVTMPGFRAATHQLDLGTSVPAQLEVRLQLSGQTDSVDVLPADTSTLIDPSSSGTRATVGMMALERLPATMGSRGLEGILVSFPGFTANANGAIHPRGAHNQMTYVVDGLSISDQLTGAFANALDPGIVQAVEVITGNVPAEFGAKVSGVAVVTTRSGLGLGRPFAGEAGLTAGSLGLAQGSVQAGHERTGAGMFVSLNGMRTDRFLDQVSRDNLHNRGRAIRGFARIDRQQDARGVRGLLRVQAMAGRSTFEVANLRSQQVRGQDQHQTLTDLSGWASYLRPRGQHATWEGIASVRTSAARLTPSAGDTPVTASQTRRLSTQTISARYTRLAGRHTIRAGGDLQRFPVRESFTLAVTDPTFNEPESDGFNPALLGHDLTRGGEPFAFTGARAGWLTSGFAQVTSRWRTLTTTAGLRFDAYRFIVREHQWQPRVGLAWSLPDTQTVLRASYNRNLQTPPNENLLLSSSDAAAQLAPPAVRRALGGRAVPVRSERQDVYEVGLQQALFGRLSLDLSAYAKRSRDQQDNNNFFDTGIIFPTSLAALRARGLEMRLIVPPTHGWSGSVSVTSARAEATPPFTGGLFIGQDAVDLLSAGPFLIDHDQRLSLHGTAIHTRRSGFWVSGSARYDSGLVSNPSDPAAVAADPDVADLLPFVDLAAAVPRVRARVITDVMAGYDRPGTARVRWGVRVLVANVANQTALYNFQSVFVGTRLVPPRTVSARLLYRW